VLEWAAARNCQVDALARNLLEALQQWPYVLEIITKLCISVNVRDALLRYDPTLLSQAVAQAVSGDWQHSAASIAMLSHPLPQNITLPAASQNLFLGIVDHATQQPSTASFRPIYLLLKGGLAPLLGLLSHDTLTQLERHFLDVLRNTIGNEDQCLSLYCLAIMKAIVTAADEDPSFATTASYETQELLASTPSSPKWKPKSMKQYFTGDKASKTLHLIVLRVLWAARATAEGNVEETVEILGLANELIMFLPEATRETWCDDHPNPLVVRKLKEKAVHSELETRVQLPAFAFICGLCRARDIPETMVDRLAVILSTATNLTAKLTAESEPSIKWFASVLNGAQLADIMISITSFAVRGSATEIIKLASVVVAVVECLSQISRTHESVVDGALGALGSPAVAQDLTSLRQIFNSVTAAESPKEGVCGAAVLSGRKAIGHAISGFFLSAALSADHSQTNVDLELYPLLVETHALSVQTSPSCTHIIAQPLNQRRPSIEPSTEAFKPGTNWQNALGDHLQNKVRQEQTALSAFFSTACADLERRCSEVEAPLREEKEKRAGLQNQYDNLYRAYTTLEDSKGRAELRADSLEAEKSEFAHDLEQSREENDELLARVGELEASLRENQSKAREELDRLKQELANAEMDHATASAQSEEQIEELEAKLEVVRTESESKKADNEQLRVEMGHARERNTVMEAELRKWHKTDEEHKLVIAAAEKARDELERNCAGLRADLEGLRQSSATEKASLEARSVQLEREAHEQAESMRAQREQDLHVLEQMRQIHQEKLDDLWAKLSSAQEESKQTQADLESQLDKREKKLAEYYKKVIPSPFPPLPSKLQGRTLTLHQQIDHLKQVCTDKDDQIAEANAMRSNLMAAMGLGKMNPQGSQSAKKRRSTRNSNMNNSEFFDETESSVPFIDFLGAAKVQAAGAAATQRGNSDNAAVATQDGSQMPLAASPKRARSRKSMAPPTVPRTSAGRTTRSSTQGGGGGGRGSAGKRQPLRVVDGNVSPSKSVVGFKGFDESEVNGGGFEDTTTFDGSEVFTSTPGIKLGGNGNGGGEGLPDDDTEMV
jgi:hypothetical protein